MSRRYAAPRAPGADTPAAAAPSSSAAPPAGVRAAVLAALALAVLAAFGGVVRNGWLLFDDPTYVTQNWHVLAGWSLAGAAYFLRAPHSGNWHPLTSWSHMLDVQLFGRDPGAHHAVSLALHVANVLLLVLVLRRLTGDWWRSVIAGALFGLHPLRVESVAWVSERKDVLSGLFFLLTLWAYARWVERPAWPRYAAVAVLLTLGLLAKPMLVTTPLVLLLLDVWPLGRWRAVPRAALPPNAARAAGAPRGLGALVLEKLPLFALAAVAAVATFLVQRAFGAVAATSATPIGHRLANAALSYARYVLLTLWPHGLGPFYADAPVPPLAGAASVLALVLVTALALARLRTRPALAVGWGWYVLMLSPVIGLVQVGAQAYADRYTYLPALGLLIVLLWALPVGRAGRVLAPLALIAAALLGVLAARQVARWRDTRTLFTALLAAGHESAQAHNALGAALFEAKRDSAAIGEFTAAVRLNPGYEDPQLNLLEAFERNGRFAEAARIARETMRVWPRDPQPVVLLATAQMNLGAPGEAAALLRHALELAPDDVEALRRLAILTATRGDLGGASALLQRAAAISPADPYVQYALGKALYASGGSLAAAVEHLRRAAELAPDWAAPCDALAFVLATTADPSVRNAVGALHWSARAVELTHGTDANPIATQAAAQAAAGQYDAAVATARRALALARSHATPGDSTAASIAENLERYERHLPPTAVR